MFNVLTLIGLILLEAFSTIMSGCSQENVLKLKLAVCRLDATLGDARAQCNLGRAYDNGEGVTQDKEEAAKWYRKAAEQGYAKAQYNLGASYHFGEGVEQNLREGVKWFRKAAEQGFATAQFGLGECYYHGQGVGQDDKEAIRWYRLAAEQGYDKAQFNSFRMVQFLRFFA